MVIRIAVCASAVAALALFGPMRPAASSEAVIHDFAGGKDGTPAFPVRLLVRASGASFGVTTTGGDKKLNHGEVYRLFPPSAGHPAWRKAPIWIFGGPPDGFGPRGSLLGVPKSSSLYGTTQLGGLTSDPGCAPTFIGCGTVFQLVPKVGGGWTKTILHSFTQADGNEPAGGLVADPDGALYGTTGTTIFRLAPPAVAGGVWTLSVLHRFGGNDGSGSNPDLMRDKAGVLYGTTSDGGRFNHGTVFALAPPAAGQTQWQYMHLHDFEGAPNDGGAPNGGLVGGAGDLWGTTREGGAGTGCPNTGCGVLFELVQQFAGNPLYTLIVQHSFSFQGTDGGFPQAGLLRAKDGTYWGTASQGGTRTATCSQGCGTVFHLAHDPIVAFRWRFFVVHAFGGFDFGDGASPSSSLAADATGALYGVTSSGGASNQGTAFQVTQ